MWRFPSRWHHRRFRFMSSLYARAKDISGRPATGPMARTDIFGFPACGLNRRKSAFCGLRDIGALRAAPMFGTEATGARTWDSTAELTMDLATAASGFSADAGTAAYSLTTPQ